MEIFHKNLFPQLFSGHKFYIIIDWIRKLNITKKL